MPQFIQVLLIMSPVPVDLYLSFLCAQFIEHYSSIPYNIIVIVLIGVSPPPQITSDDKETVQVHGISTAGTGVTMNNRASAMGATAASSSASASASDAAGRNNSKATAAAVSNNLQDVQKLQQELQEIKEQVRGVGVYVRIDTCLTNGLYCLCFVFADHVPGVL